MLKPINETLFGMEERVLSCRFSRESIKKIQSFSTSQPTHCYVYTSRLLRSGLLRELKLVLRYHFLLDRLSAVIGFERSYPTMTQARQLVDQGFIILGPLVQENGSLSFICAKLSRLSPAKDVVEKEASVLIGASNIDQNLLSIFLSTTFGFFPKSI